MGGVISISWQELYAWANLTDRDLSPNEATLIMHMSACYAAEHGRSSGTRELNPLMSEQEQLQRKLKARMNSV